MNYDAVIAAINNPTADFYQLFPQNNNGVFEPYTQENTLPFKGKPWFSAQPRHFKKVETIDDQFQLFRLTLAEGSCVISRSNFDTLYNGFCDIYVELHRHLKDAETLTKVTALAWLQEFHIKNSLFIPLDDGHWWDVYDNEDYAQFGAKAHGIHVKTISILTLFPDATELFSNIRDLNLTSASFERVLEQTCVKQKVMSESLLEPNQLDLPGNISSDYS